MAVINYSDVTVETNTQNQNQVGFFNLQNDGEEAVVRFMIDSVNDFEILTVHDVRVDGRFRQISCVRDPREPLDKCPLCARGERVKQVVFIKMIQYVNTPNGIEVKPVVWQRNASSYAPRLKGYIDNYGPLSNILCKIVRHGAKGDMRTTYDIIPNLSPMQFPQEQYPIITDAFDGYKALGRIVLDKPANEIAEFVNTGKFPEVNNETGNYTQVTPQPTPVPNYEPQSTSTYTTYGSWEHNTQQVPRNDTVVDTPSMGRPNRYY